MNDNQPPMPTSFEEETIPHSRETEEALLGAVLLSPKWIKVLDLRPKDFYLHKNRWIWQTLCELNDEEAQIDFISVSDRLDKKKLLGELGGPAYLASLLSLTPTSLHAETYARILRDRTSRRELLQLANETARQAYQLETPVTTIQGGLMQNILSIHQSAQGSVSLAEWIEAAQIMIRDAEENGKPAGVETGFSDFDKITGGIRPGRFEILSGVPGMGKSIFYQNVAVNLAKKNCPGNLYSAEMPKQDMSLRMLSAESGIEVSRLESGQIRDDEYPAYVNALATLSSIPLYVSDDNAWTIPALRADLTRAQETRGIQWFVFDYMDLLRDEYGENETERTKYLSRHLRAICRDLGLHGMAIQSMVKSGFDKPGMEHLAGSAGLAYDADLIMFIMEHISDSGGSPDGNIRTMMIKKGRHLQNPQRYFYLYKRPTLPKFENAVKHTVDLSNATMPVKPSTNGNGYHKKAKA